MDVYIRFFCLNMFCVSFHVVGICFVMFMRWFFCCCAFSLKRPSCLHFSPRSFSAAWYICHSRCTAVCLIISCYIYGFSSLSADTCSTHSSVIAKEKTSACSWAMKLRVIHGAKQSDTKKMCTILSEANGQNSGVNVYKAHKWTLESIRVFFVAV